MVRILNVKTSNVENIGNSHGFILTELVLRWNDKDYRLTYETVLNAFESTGYGKLTDKDTTYYIKVKGDLKSLQEVIGRIVPINEGQFTQKMMKMICDIFEGLGFEVLDRRKQHL